MSEDLIITPAEIPEELSTVPQLDFTGDLSSSRLTNPWTIIASLTHHRQQIKSVESAIRRESLLIAPGSFVRLYDSLENIGNVLHGVGKPGGAVLYGSDGKSYDYRPIHRFEFPFTNETGEPLVFFYANSSGDQKPFINPDLNFYFDLEERPAGSGSWWDPKTGEEALRTRDAEGQIDVGIRTAHLLEYLRARQRVLLVGHYRHLHLFDPQPESVAVFTKSELTIGSPTSGSKAVLENWGFRTDIGKPFLQRRLHLWFIVNPPPIDIENPWAEAPSFDVYSFTLPTAEGPVAPARFSIHRVPDRHVPFGGTTCDFMDHVYFRQEVLQKYEGTAGFEVHDDGSVVARHYWGLNRSTSRIGNDYITTAIGDFAEGVTLKEWPHWGHYAVAPADVDTSRANAEVPIPTIINSLVDTLEDLNSAFATLKWALRSDSEQRLWLGSRDSSVARRLKYFYPAGADENVFLERATFASTLVLDGLQAKPLRATLGTFGHDLHLSDDNPPRPLGSRRLLDRVVLAAAVYDQLRPDISAMAELILDADRKASMPDPDLATELQRVRQSTRISMAPLALLYDLRSQGGLAHPQGSGFRDAAAGLGLSKSDWTRRDFLKLVSAVQSSIEHAASRITDFARALALKQGGYRSHYEI
jgi:hypothetical protein